MDLRGTVMVEIKAVKRVTPDHGVRLRSFLRYSRPKRGWPLKFQFWVLDQGIGERGSK
jgi:hypothetical protein